MDENANTLILEKEEEWKPLPDWEDIYEVSSNGRLRTKDRIVEVRKRGKIINAHVDECGYPRITLCRGYETKHKYLHAVVCETYHGARPEGMQVAHGDGDPLNNTAKNLRWATVQENADDRKRHGTHPARERNGRAKLTREQAAHIRMSPISNGVLAKHYGVSTPTIQQIKSGRTWKT